ncbi:hypothetical protein PHSC3_001134 [Chlamydiales bacterium STE3]|nr:hypothetical protein PHSC3_001134 [Chlamydiales bacterium STE3]
MNVLKADAKIKKGLHFSSTLKELKARVWKKVYIKKKGIIIRREKVSLTDYGEGRG